MKFIVDTAENGFVLEYLDPEKGSRSLADLIMKDPKNAPLRREVFLSDEGLLRRIRELDDSEKKKRHDNQRAGMMNSASIFGGPLFGN